MHMSLVSSPIAKAWNIVASHFLHERKSFTRQVAQPACFSSWHEVWFKRKAFRTFPLVMRETTHFMSQWCTIQISCRRVGGHQQFRSYNKPSGEGLTFLMVSRDAGRKNMFIMQQASLSWMEPVAFVNRSWLTHCHSTYTYMWVQHLPLQLSSLWTDLT